MHLDPQKQNHITPQSSFEKLLHRVQHLFRLGVVLFCLSGVIQMSEANSDSIDSLTSDFIFLPEPHTDYSFSIDEESFFPENSTLRKLEDLIKSDILKFVIKKLNVDEDSVEINSKSKPQRNKSN